MDTKAFFKLSYGVYIVSSAKDGKFNGQIANTVFQLSAEPAFFGISINKQNLTHEFITSSKSFSISVLSNDVPLIFIGKLGFKSGRNTNKFEGISFDIGANTMPCVNDFCTAHIVAEVIATADAATHTLFIGKVIDAKVLNDKEPLTYSDYHLIKGGKTPKSATTYVEKV